MPCLGFISFISVRTFQCTVCTVPRCSDLWYIYLHLPPKTSLWCIKWRYIGLGHWASGVCFNILATKKRVHGNRNATRVFSVTISFLHAYDAATVCITSCCSSEAMQITFTQRHLGFPGVYHPGEISNIPRTEHTPVRKSLPIWSHLYFGVCGVCFRQGSFLEFC